jgi:hypothetical protein
MLNYTDIFQQMVGIPPVYTERTRTSIIYTSEILRGYSNKSTKIVQLRSCKSILMHLTWAE